MAQPERDTGEQHEQTHSSSVTRSAETEQSMIALVRLLARQAARDAVQHQADTVDDDDASDE
ncbi:hypothetical protein [Ferruginivarius sediminum]|uniref:Uncharacterized protein n=1 Tax=Ferruginivarius sediminum TaxID=2661937 RepID=A0A369T7G3_9PROT|nr:hypothetical protein [Ferruginivarius sediminum]RDD61250.1 hypothetical protein DRB17_14315 [Ferruginivarius sediminum]